jgi:hypothetical protein
MNLSVPRASVMDTTQGHIRSKGAGMVDALFAGLLDDQQCPCCGTRQPMDVASFDDQADARGDRVCLACESAVFVNPILNPIRVLARRRSIASATRTSRSSAA